MERRRGVCGKCSMSVFLKREGRDPEREARRGREPSSPGWWLFVSQVVACLKSPAKVSVHVLYTGGKNAFHPF